MNVRRRGRWSRALALATGLLLVAGCGLESGGAVPLQVGPGSIRPVPELDGVRIIVGSKDFTEQNILGYLIEFAMTAAGAEVRDLTNIQGSNSLRDAQLHGQIDVAYDYTGTGWVNYLGKEKPVPDEPRTRVVDRPRMPPLTTASRRASGSSGASAPRSDVTSISGCAATSSERWLGK